MLTIGPAVTSTPTARCQSLRSPNPPIVSITAATNLTATRIPVSHQTMADHRSMRNHLPAK
ncbi:MAG: hypothetical protein ACKOOI_09985, partial [Pirellula sp.]